MLATKIYLCLLAIMILVTFIIYGIDKAKAKKSKERIRESTLCSLSIFGGAIGGLFAMCIFRHKINHVKFWVTNIMGLVIQLTFLAVLLFFELPTLIK